MKRASLGLAGLMLVTPATPLFATQGMDCVSRQRGAPTYYMSVGSGGGVDLVLIRSRGREVRASGLPDANARIVRESYMDRAGRVRVRIVSRDRRTMIARLVLGTGGAGVLRYRGRDWRVRCRWEPQD